LRTRYYRDPTGGYLRVDRPSHCGALRARIPDHPGIPDSVSFGLVTAEYVQQCKRVKQRDVPRVWLAKLSPLLYADGR
jgi:hypothetical protein